ncbi:hypothetical protein ACRALDRAFT_2026829 [Sodiomyces alcalophilus JCM 7366]|uniref:uncharacterized protein n=1 Tax=Sodiomyces alcalophilus JCM 7366 TaxID=591952 RepID=UPI0039B654F2
MDDLDLPDAPPPPDPAPKRRRVAATRTSLAPIPRYDSPDELTVAFRETASARRVSVRRGRLSRSPPSRRSSDDELNGSCYSPPPRSISPGRSRPRSSKQKPQSRSRSRSRSRLRSRMRRRSPTPTRSTSPENLRPSRRQRRRSQSQSSMPSHSRSSSFSPDRRSPASGSGSPSRLSARSTSRSPSRSRSRSRTHSESRSPSATSSPRSLAVKLERRLHLSPETPTPPSPPRQPVRPDYHPHMTLSGHRQAVSQVRISPDGRWIASASADGTVKIWDAATGEHMDTLVGHMAGISCVAWSPDGGTLATGSDDKAIRLWDRVTGRPKLSAKGVPGGKEGAARPMPPLLGHHNYVVSLAFSPKGNILASGSYDEAVFLWDARAGRLMRSLPAHSDPVSGIGFCLDGTLVVSCSTDGLIRIWDTYTGQCLRTLVHEDNPAVTSVCFSPNGRFVLAYNLDNCIRLWDYVSGTVKKTYQGHRNEKFAIGGCFGLLPLEGPEAEARGEAKTDTRNGDAPNGTASDGGGGAPGARTARGQPQAPFIASPSEDGHVVLWDVTSKEVVQRISAHPGHVCFWVDVLGDTMVTAGQDGSIRVFKHRSSTTKSSPSGDGREEQLVLNGDPGVANGDRAMLDSTMQQTSDGVDLRIKMEEEMDMDVDGS